MKFKLGEKEVKTGFYQGTWLDQLVEHATLDPRVLSLSLMLGA